MKTALFSIFFTFFSFSQAQEMLIAGSAVQAWPGDESPIASTPIYSNGDGTYFVMGIELLDGEVRFREEQNWETSYGGTEFPSGTISDNDIPVEEGLYDVLLDLNNNTYSFVSYPRVSIISFGQFLELSTDDTEIFNLSVNQFDEGIRWFYVNTHPAIMEVDEYGGDNFPSGNLLYWGNPLVIEAGFYEVTFNLPALTYSFDVPDIGIIGSAVVETTGDEDAISEVLMSSTHGAIYTLSNVELQAGELKFRQNQSWDINWGGSAFPSGDLIVSSVDDADTIMVTEAGSYDVTFDRENQTYMFTTLSTLEKEFKALTIYPNPTKDTWNIKSGNATIKSISIFSMSGKRIKQMKVSNQNETQIDASNFDSGIYMIKLTAVSGYTKTLKLIKQ